MTLDEADLLIERFETCASATEVGAVFAAAVQQHGFLAVSAGETRATNPGRDWSFFFNTWPPEWLEVYRARNYVKVDLLPSLALHADHPFSWSDRAGATPSNPHSEEFEAWLATIGVVDGFAVPQRYPGDDLGLCVAVAGRRIDGAVERRALHLASIYAMRRCRALSAPGVAAGGANPLTERERACMRWVLEGKSDRDIGEILGISHTTVHFHVEHIKRKLGVRTRLQAARIVIALGYA